MLKNIQTKIFFVLSAIVLFIVITTYANYVMHKKNYQEFIEYSIENAIATIRSSIQKTEEVASQSMMYKYDYFKKIHEKALLILRHEPKQKLSVLKSKIDEMLDSSLVSIDFYLIGQDYVIYRTTKETDLHLDMSNFLGAKEYIDKAFQNSGEVFVSKNLSYDVITQEYTVYSYAALNWAKKTILEIGFLDKTASRIKNTLYQFNLQDSLIKKVDLYADYGKYVVNVTQGGVPHNMTKQEFMLKNISSDSEEIRIIKEVSQSKTSQYLPRIEADKRYLVCYTHVMDMSISENKNKNYILKTKLDVTLFENKMDDLGTILYLTVAFSIFFIFFFFFFLNSTFVKPFGFILKSIQSWQKIHNEKILKKDDELSQLACSFNYIYDKQVKFNNTLEERIQKAIQENEEKEKLLRKQLKLAQMGEMLSMIAHQWRQPLGSIGSAVVSLQLNLRTKQRDFCNEKELKEYLSYVDGKYQAISEYVQFLSATIDDFRNFYTPSHEKEWVGVLIPIQKSLQILEGSFDKNGLIKQSNQIPA